MDQLILAIPIARVVTSLTIASAAMHSSVPAGARDPLVANAIVRVSDDLAIGFVGSSRTSSGHQ